MSKRFVCPYCNEEFDIRGKKLHLLKCENEYMKKKYNHTEQKDIILKESPQKNQQAGDCKHNFRLLSAREPLEAEALKLGYNRVCILCQEVEK